MLNKLLVGKSFFIFFVVAFTFVTVNYYPGSASVFFIYSLFINYYLCSNLNKNISFFELFFGIFLWLGLWLKLAVRLVFASGEFYENVGAFDSSASSFDQTLIICSVALIGLIAASSIRKRYFNYNSLKKVTTIDNLTEIYSNHRLCILSLYLSFVMFIGCLNFNYGFYQRGLPPSIILPFGLNNIFTWLLTFGFTSLSAVLVFLDLRTYNQPTVLIIAIVLLESFITNTSMRSRAMIGSAGTVFLGMIAYIQLHHSIIKAKTIYISLMLLTILLSCSFLMTQKLRFNKYLELQQQQEVIDDLDNRKDWKNSKVLITLLLDRWVGIEGVMAVSSYKDKSWNTFHQLFVETPKQEGTSFFDKEIVKSYYSKIELKDKHFVTLPGLVAFLSIPGSYLFLFIGIFFLSLFAVFIEALSFKLSNNNMILSAVFGEVIAFRYAHFGYLPQNSLAFFAAILFNIVLIYLLLHCLPKGYQLFSKIKIKRLPNVDKAIISNQKQNYR